MSAPSAPILLQERKFFFFFGETADVTSDLEVHHLRVQALPRLVNISNSFTSFKVRPYSLRSTLITARSGVADCAGIRADHRRSQPVQWRQADCQLSRSGSGRRFQWGTTTAGTRQQTGQRVTAFLARGSRAGDGAQRTTMAQPIFTPCDATRTKDRESSHIAEMGGSFVLDVAPRMGLPATGTVRFARGTAWNRPWCAVNHRRND
jgi:hypothetical protein